MLDFVVVHGTPMVSVHGSSNMVLIVSLTSSLRDSHDRPLS